MKKTFEYIKVKPAMVLAGGRTALANMAGVTRMTVWSWEKKDGLIPSHYTAEVRKKLRAHKSRLDTAYKRVMK